MNNAVEKQLKLVGYVGDGDFEEAIVIMSIF